MIVQNQYSLSPALGGELQRYQRTATIVGIVGLVLCAIGFFTTTPQQFLRSYLVGFIFWLGVLLGCMSLMMIQYMSGGAWGMMIRRSLEAGTRTWMLVALLAIPLLIGVPALYVWTQPHAAQSEALRKAIEGKRLYLNLPFFYFRAVLYFAIWGTIITLLNRWSLAQDRTGDIVFSRRLEKLSGPGIVIYAFTTTFAATDWIMSLDPTWFSTIYGLLVCVGQNLSALALIIATLVLMGDKPPLAGLITKRHLHDLGKLLLALTMLWAYLSFSQLILIWSGNLPEEISWYTNRLNGGWEWVGATLLLFHFTFPFLMLLSQALKKNPRTIRRIAIYVIVVRLVDIIWLVEPNFGHGHLNLHWLDFATPIGIGGLWLAYFFYNLRQRPLLPIHAPDLEKALNHGRHHH